MINHSYNICPSEQQFILNLSKSKWSPKILVLFKILQVLTSGWLIKMNKNYSNTYLKNAYFTVRFHWEITWNMELFRAPSCDPTCSYKEAIFSFLFFFLKIFLSSSLIPLNLAGWMWHVDFSLTVNYKESFFDKKEYLEFFCNCFL